MLRQSNHSAAGTLHRQYGATHFRTDTPQTPRCLQWGGPHLAPKITPSRELIPKPDYVPASFLGGQHDGRKPYLATRHLFG